MLVGPGQVVTYLYWIGQVQRLGLDDTSTPGLNERRLFYESGRYLLKVWSGSNWVTVNEYTATDILGAIETVDGPGSGLNSDLLDDQEGSYYRNAGNLNAGTVPQARLSASVLLTLIKTVDGSGSGLDTDLVCGLKIQTGTAAGSTSGQYNSFPSAFSSTPVIVVTPKAANSGVPYVASRTTTGFTLVTPTTNTFCDYFAAG
jgi:hypothetical protein